MYQYTGYLGQPYKYTYRGTFWIKAGVYTEFYTSNPSPANTDPVMYLYSQSNPASYSWSDDDGAGNRQSRIANNIYFSDYYTLVVRAYSTSTYGTVKIYHNGSLIQNSAVVAGNMYAIGASATSGMKNYLTCDPNRSSGKDTYLWIFQGYTAPVTAFNDDYYKSGGGDFNFNRYSRIKSDASDITWALISAYSPTGNNSCDMYFGNLMVDKVEDWWSYFPNLKYDDVVQSADSSSDYNCFSWSGGRTTLGIFSPAEENWPNNPWYDTRGEKQCYDNFYGNINQAGINTPRFYGADTYIPTSDPSKSVVDLYYSNQSGLYEHAAVRKPGDSFYHGYSWESKIARRQRIFHPRYALNGGKWGDVSAYYKLAGATQQATGKSENIRGSIDADAALTSAEYGKFTALLNTISKEKKVRFNALYEEWKDAWTSREIGMKNKPHDFIKSKDYKILSQYCKTDIQTARLMLMEKCLNGDSLAGYAICKMGLFDQTSRIMEKTRAESPQGQITDDGFFIVDNERSGWNRFIKNLIEVYY